jgi:hypothetical protein
VKVKQPCGHFDTHEREDLQKQPAARLELKAPPYKSRLH